jgi:hypothetical protein
MRKTPFRMWRRSRGAGGACCVGARGETCDGALANRWRAAVELLPAARLTLFCSGATEAAVAGVWPEPPAQHSAHDSPCRTRAAAPFSRAPEASPALAQFIPARGARACSRAFEFSRRVFELSCEASCDARCDAPWPAFDSPVLARQQSCSSGAEGALASCTHHADAAACAPLHTPVVSVRSMPKMRANRRINSRRFRRLLIVFRSASI